jgi:hypothetical protein
MTLNMTKLWVEGRNSTTFPVNVNEKPLWFGAVQVKKNYVSYHLMPVYLNPALLETVSPGLLKRMQGKSCFNFTSSDAQLFRELAELTEAGFNDYVRQGFIQTGARN